MEHIAEFGYHDGNHGFGDVDAGFLEFEGEGEVAEFSGVETCFGVVDGSDWEALGHRQ